METSQPPLNNKAVQSPPEDAAPTDQRKDSILPLPTILTYPSSSPPLLITQGAEALLFKTTFLFPDFPSALKYRPPKPYRHPILDARLTKHRILSEARVLVKCRREGVPVPGVYAIDEKGGWIMMEWVEGEVVRVRLNKWLRRRRRQAGDTLLTVEGDDTRGLDALLARVGRAVGGMHKIGVVHGDLTTSNLMLREKSALVEDKTEDNEGQRTPGVGEEEGLDGDIVLIDFGLASQSELAEDRAVDLYVLERAFASTHPNAEDHFGKVLEAYGTSFKGAMQVLKRLEDVRMRGRKRSMLG